MTATERLRALLDERGVKHSDGTECTLWGYEPRVSRRDVCRFYADEQDGMLCVHMWCETPEHAVEATLGREGCAECAVKMGEYADSLCDPLKVKLGELEKRTESLLRILRDEWRIEASWDGLRHFWYVGLTDEGVRERDEREAENERLRDCLAASEEEAKVVLAENRGLRELVKDMYRCMCAANEQDWFYFERDKSGCGLSCTINGEGCGLLAIADRMRELGVEVDA